MDLTDEEKLELEYLRKIQKSRTTWLTQDQFDRIQELADKSAIVTRGRKVKFKCDKDKWWYGEVSYQSEDKIHLYIHVYNEPEEVKLPAYKVVLL